MKEMYVSICVVSCVSVCVSVSLCEGTVVCVFLLVRRSCDVM